MENFRIVGRNLRDLMMQKQSGSLSQSLPPVKIEISDIDVLGDNLYTNEIKVTISRYIEDSDDSLYMELKYTPLVYISSDEDLEKIMRENVPCRLFNYVRVLVWNLSLEVGLPIMLEKDDWCVPEECDQRKVLSQESEHSTPVLNGQKDALQEIVAAFKELPSYDYYYRFITPIEYEHPDLEECDEELWNVLYQLLFGSFVMDCHLDERIDGSLDLRFCDVNGHDSSVSKLTLYELDVLMLHLWTAMGNDLLPVMEEGNLNQEREFKFGEDDLISKEDFFSLYKLDEGALDSNLYETVEKMYEKIVKCDAESFSYRC